MSDRRTRIYNNAIAGLASEPQSLRDLTDDVNQLLQEERPGDTVSQVDVLVAVSVLGKATIRVIEQDNGIWLQRISAT